MLSTDNIFNRLRQIVFKHLNFEFFMNTNVLCEAVSEPLKIGMYSFFKLIIQSLF